jgi:hypothetical protein
VIAGSHGSHESHESPVDASHGRSSVDINPALGRVWIRHNSCGVATSMTDRSDPAGNPDASPQAEISLDAPEPHSADEVRYASLIRRAAASIDSENPSCHSTFFSPSYSNEFGLSGMYGISPWRSASS